MLVHIKFVLRIQLNTRPYFLLSRVHLWGAYKSSSSNELFIFLTAFYLHVCNV